MKVIGLTGSIAMGKSEVAKVLASEGLPVFDADKEVHALYDSQEGAELLQPLVPKAVEAGQVNREKLAAHLLEHPEDLEPLEQIVHAAVDERRNRFIAHQKAAGADLVVFDIPLLFEKKLERTVNWTVVVSAPRDMQMCRALERKGMTRNKLALILKRQMPDSVKRKNADFVVENDGDLELLRTRTLAVLGKIRKDMQHA
jgi:dephospho-CoA kinase